MQERRDADVGEIENSGEEQECRKKTKTERAVKAMRNSKFVHRVMSVLLCMVMICCGTLNAMASTATANPASEEATKTTLNKIARSELKNSAEIAEYIETVVGKETLCTTVIEEKNAYCVEGTDCNIVIPKIGNGFVLMQTNGYELGMTLPRIVTKSKGYVSENGTVVYTSEDKNSSIAVQAISDKKDGMAFDAVRTMITIENANAAKEYQFDFDLPEGYSLISDYDYKDSHDKWDCGDIYIIDENNNIMATIDAAWAKDANGQNIETYYKVKGNSLIQHITFDNNTAFPIIADPTAHPTKYTHYYTDYPTLEGVIDQGYDSCNSLGVTLTVFILEQIGSGSIGATPVSGMMLVAELWSFVQFKKVEAKYDAMTKTQWLKTTYTHTWRNGGKNSGYVRSATPDIKIVARKGA